MVNYNYTNDGRGNGELPRQSGPTGWFHYQVVDIDMDGDDDIIALDGAFPPFPDGAYPLKIFINDGAGNFSDQTSSIISGAIPTTTHPDSVFVDDFNGDGRLDIIIGDNGYDGAPFPGAKNVLLLSQSDGRLVDKSENLSSFNTQVESMTVADIDGDGDLDVYVGAIGPRIDGGDVQTPVLLINDGLGNFSDVSNQLPTSVTEKFNLGGSNYIKNVKYSSHLADLNNDGAAELIVGPGLDFDLKQPSTVTVFWNDGKGNYSDANATQLAKSQFNAEVHYEMILSFDVNMDGFLDILVMSHPDYGIGGYALQIHVNDGHGGFVDETSTRLPLASLNEASNAVAFASIEIIDFDFDGDLDFFGFGFPTGITDSRPVLWINDGNGIFSEVKYWSEFLSYGQPNALVRAPGGNGYDIVSLGAPETAGPTGYNTLSADHDLTTARTLQGDAFFNLLHGGKNVDTIMGLGGNDVIFGFAGNDIINGGSGIDTSKYSGSRSDYTVVRNIDGSFNFTDNRAGNNDGSDVLTDIERLSLSDGILAIDINGIAGQAYRLYQAAFDRTPDTDGLRYWVGELDRGAGDLAWMANNFIISDEFRSTYGSPETVNDTAFLTLIYKNVLDRTPDLEGFQYWMSQLGSGFERERVLASFSESTENQTNVIGAIEDGIWLG